MEQRKFEFKPEIKAMAAEALTKLSFSQVNGVMQLIKREGNHYTEAESNAIVGFLGEMAYRDVAHIFEAMPTLVKEVTPETADEAPTQEGEVTQPVTAEA